MQHISKILTAWTGSTTTEAMIREQIKAKFGNEAAAEYDPKINCRTYKSWGQIGYKVKPKSKALRSFIVLETKNEKGEIIERHVRNVNLFCLQQVERVKF